MSTRVLEGLTLDAVKATSIAHHLQRGERSHFNPEVSEHQRLAELGELVGQVFQSAALVPDSAKLQQALLWLSATSAIWAEQIDKRGECTCPWMHAELTEEPPPCKHHPEEFARRMGMLRLKEGGIIK